MKEKETTPYEQVSEALQGIIKGQMIEILQKEKLHFGHLSSLRTKLNLLESILRGGWTEPGEDNQAKKAE